MLDGFEAYSEDLNMEDRKLAQRLVTGFEKRIGKENAITNTMVRGKMMEAGVTISDPKMRKLISYIRLNYLPQLCASSDGYYCAKDSLELEAYLKSSWQRISQQHAAYSAGMDKLSMMKIEERKHVDKAAAVLP